MFSSYSRKVFAILVVMCMLLSTGFGRQMTGDSFASPPAPLEENEGKLREMMEKDYEDAGPNINQRSAIPTLDPQAPAPQP